MTSLPPFELGNPGYQRNTLVNAVLAGKKTATSSLLREWQEEGNALPKVGTRYILIDANGVGVAQIMITRVEVQPFVN